MGQAKARGSFATRQAEALERIAQENQRQEEAAAQAAVNEAGREAEAARMRETSFRKYSPIGISANNRSHLMMAALALTAMGPEAQVQRD